VAKLKVMWTDPRGTVPEMIDAVAVQVVGTTLVFKGQDGQPVLVVNEDRFISAVPVGTDA
jgi:hypothetical protein